MKARCRKRTKEDQKDGLILVDLEATNEEESQILSGIFDARHDVNKKINVYGITPRKSKTILSISLFKGVAPEK